MTILIRRSHRPLLPCPSAACGPPIGCRPCGSTQQETGPARGRGHSTDPQRDGGWSMWAVGAPWVVGEQVECTCGYLRRRGPPPGAWRALGSRVVSLVGWGGCLSLG
eukprot:8462165-Pyramimonas_sp.AAC.1